MDKYIVKKPNSRGFKYEAVTYTQSQSEMIEALAKQFEGIGQVCQVFMNKKLICIFNVRSKPAKWDNRY